MATRQAYMLQIEHYVTQMLSAWPDARMVLGIAHRRTRPCGHAARSWTAWQTCHSYRLWGKGGGTTGAAQKTTSTPSPLQTGPTVALQRRYMHAAALHGLHGHASCQQKGS